MHKYVVVLVVLLFSIRCENTFAQEEKLGEETVLATIGTEPITQAKVDFHLSRPAGSPELSRAALENTLLLMAQQRQALQTLRRSDQAADKEEIYRWLEESYAPDDKSAGEALSGEQILESIASGLGVLPETVREQIAFRLSWKQYLGTHLNQKNLVRHFGSQVQRFDGTEFRVRMISIPAPAGICKDRDKATVELKAKVAELATLDAETEIPEKQLGSMVQVMQSRWVRGMGDLDNRIVDAILKLKVGNWSPVFHTATGVHSLQLLEVQDGDKELEQVKDAVRIHMLVFLLEGLSKQSAKLLPLKRIHVGN